MAPKKRKRPPLDEHVEYIVEITDWDWQYSFGLDRSFHPIGPYSEYRHLHINGRLVRPNAVKAESVALVFVPSTDLNEANRGNLHPISVGELQQREETLHGLLSIPEDALPLILQMLIASRAKFIEMSGSKLRWRQTKIRGFRIESKLDEDEPPEDA